MPGHWQLLATSRSAIYTLADTLSLPDSTAVPDSIWSSALVQVDQSGSRDAVSQRIRVDSLRARRASSQPNAATATGLVGAGPVFDATLAPSRHASTLVPTKPFDCATDEASVAALALAEGVVFSMPATLAVGQTWTDTVRTASCRARVPVNVTVVMRDSVIAITDREVQLARSWTSAAAGTLPVPVLPGVTAPAGREMTAHSRGHGEGDARIDRATGRVIERTVRSETLLQMSVGMRSRTLLQRSELRLESR